MTPKEIKLGPGQFKAFQSKARFIALVAGIQSGKTFAGATWLINQADKYPNDEHLILASSYKVLNQATLRKFEQLAPKGWFKKVKSPEEFYYQILPNDKGRTGQGRIWVRSAENANKIEGMTLRSCWFDEAGDGPEMAFENVQGRLSIKQGKCLLTSTPYLWNWLKKFEDDWRADTANGTREGELSYDYINYPSSDNPYFPKGEFERAKRALAPHVFERRYLGLFTRPEGLVYSVFDFENCMWSKSRLEMELALDPIHEVIGAVDWGYNDPAAMNVVAITQRGRYILLDEYYQTKQTQSTLVDVARGLKAKWNVKYFYADSAEPKSIRDFNSKGIVTMPVRKVPGQTGTSYINEGISKVRQLMAEGRLIVVDSNRETKRELGAYRYKSKEIGGVKIVIDDPEDADNHLMDVLRYVVDSHYVVAYEKPEAETEWNPLDQVFKRLAEKETDDTIEEEPGGFGMYLGGEDDIFAY
jgi:PBSX family phage terminase large subunit